MAIAGSKTEADRLPKVYATARIEEVKAVKYPDADKIAAKEAQGKTALTGIPLVLRLQEDQPYRTARTGFYYHPSFFGPEPVDVAGLDSSLKWAWKGSIVGEPGKPSLCEALGIDADTLDAATSAVDPEDEQALGEALRDLLVEAQGRTFGAIFSQQSERVDDIDADGNPTRAYILTDKYELDGGYGQSCFFGQSKVEGLERREEKQEKLLAEGAEVKNQILLGWDRDTSVEIDFEG